MKPMCCATSPPTNGPRKYAKLTLRQKIEIDLKSHNKAPENTIRIKIAK